eukprot:2713390-Rhodomonas_salina.1
MASVASQLSGCKTAEEAAEDVRKRKWRMQGLKGMVEGLILLNLARSAMYCERHDCLDCANCSALFGDEWDDEGFALGTHTEDADLELTQILQSMQDVSVLNALRNR